MLLRLYQFAHYWPGSSVPVSVFFILLSFAFLAFTLVSGSHQSLSLQEEETENDFGLVRFGVCCSVLGSFQLGDSIRGTKAGLITLRRVKLQTVVETISESATKSL